MSKILYSQQFGDAELLADFVNEEGIVQADILKVDADAANSGWVIWWYAEPPEEP